MSRQDIIRAVLHFPAGCLASWLVIFVSPVLGIIFSFGFLTYEIVEDWRIKDRGYKDIFGFLIGFALTSIVIHIIYHGGSYA